MIELKTDKEIKVAKIINEYQLVITCGLKQGVEVGDIYEICGIGATVRDPDTNRVLGTLNDRKAVVKVEEVYDEMSICCNTNLTGVLLLEAVSVLAGNINKPKPLNIDITQMTGRFESGSSLIKVGDNVRFVSRAIKSNDSPNDNEEESAELLMTT